MKPVPSKRFRPPSRNRVLIDGTLDHVQRIHVAIEEKGRNASPYPIQWGQKDSIRELIPCHNPLCFDGGFSLGDLLRELVNNKQEEFIGTSFCTGREGDPEESKDRPSCATRYDVEILLRF
jgi:hypothetical protein